MSRSYDPERWGAEELSMDPIEPGVDWCCLNTRGTVNCTKMAKVVDKTLAEVFPNLLNDEKYVCMVSTNPDTSRLGMASRRAVPSDMCRR